MIVSNVFYSNRDTSAESNLIKVVTERHTNFEVNSNLNNLIDRDCVKSSNSNSNAKQLNQNNQPVATSGLEALVLSSQNHT